MLALSSCELIINARRQTSSPAHHIRRRCSSQVKVDSEHQQKNFNSILERKLKNYSRSWTVWKAPCCVHHIISFPIDERFKIRNLNEKNQCWWRSWKERDDEEIWISQTLFSMGIFWLNLVMKNREKDEINF